MDRKIRRKALRHAAKVAFGSLFSIGLGCGGSILDAQPEDAGNERDARSSAGDDASAAIHDAALHDVGVVSDAALACIGATGLDAGDVSDEAFQCCVDDVKAALADDASDFPDRITSDPAALNCCTAVIARIDTGANQQDYATAGGGVRTQCCSALGWPSIGPGYACTPWGPPMPPSMDWVV